MVTKRDAQPSERDKQTPAEPIAARKEAGRVVSLLTEPFGSPASLPSAAEMKKIVGGSDKQEYDPERFGAVPISPTFQMRLRATGLPETPPEEFYDTLPPNRRVAPIANAALVDRPNDEQMRDQVHAPERKETARSDGTGPLENNPCNCGTVELSPDFVAELKAKGLPWTPTDEFRCEPLETPGDAERSNPERDITQPSLRVQRLRRKRYLAVGSLVAVLLLGTLFALLLRPVAGDAKDAPVELVRPVQDEPEISTKANQGVTHEQVRASDDIAPALSARAIVANPESVSAESVKAPSKQPKSRPTTPRKVPNAGHSLGNSRPNAIATAAPGSPAPRPTAKPPGADPDQRIW